jgi:hypothetical protein
LPVNTGVNDSFVALICCFRVVTEESGGKASRSQAYNLLTVSGDAVLLEFFEPNANWRDYYGVTKVASGRSTGTQPAPVTQQPPQQTDTALLMKSTESNVPAEIAQSGEKVEE